MAIGQGIYTTTAGVKEWYKQKYKGQNMLDMAVNAAEQQASAATAQTYLAAEAQKGAYKSQYEQALDKAYQANLEQRSNILNSNLIAGTKREMLSDTDIALQDAYSSYLATLQGSIADVEAQEAKQYASIDKELSTVKEQADKLLTTEAENITKGIDYAFDYLQEVGKYAEQTEGGLEALYNDPNWNRYIEKYTEEGSEEPMYRMYSREQLSRPRIDVETGEQLGLYDSMGNLTKAGQDFFDQMINFDWTDYGALKDMQSYGSFVSGKDKDFYNWLSGENSYTATPDTFGRNLNIGVLREAMGLKSDDEVYNLLERRSLTTEDINILYRNFENELTNAQTAIQKTLSDTGSNAPYKSEQIKKSIITAVDNVSSDLRNKGLLTTDVEKQLSKFKDDIKSIDSKAVEKAGSFNKFYQENFETLAPNAYGVSDNAFINAIKHILLSPVTLLGSALDAGIEKGRSESTRLEDYKKLSDSFIKVLSNILKTEKGKYNKKVK